MPSKRAAGKVRLVRPRKSLEINKSWEICSFPRTFEISRHLVNREKSFPRRRNGVLACPEKVVRLYIGLANRRRLYPQGVFIYYKSFGNGPPMLILHGGPGASHDYLLPHLVPLARRNRLVFIDERGGGKSPKLENPAQ